MHTTFQPDLEQFSGPKYRALMHAIRGAIGDGTLGAGDQLPPVRTLAWQLRITPNTVARAYRDLVEAGVLVARTGHGTFVAESATASKASLETSNAILLGKMADREMIDLRVAVLAEAGQSALLKQAMAALIQSDRIDWHRYSRHADYAQLCQAILRDLDGLPLGPVTADHIVPSYGAQNAYCTVLQTILRGAKPAVMTEKISYRGFEYGAALMRASVVGIDFDDEGPCPAAIELACQQYDIQALATSTTAQNPTTIQTSPARRRDIAALAEKYDFAIIEDESYTILHNGLPSYRALAPGRSWYIASAAKSLSPALRFGYIIAPDGYNEKIWATANNGLMNYSPILGHLMAMVMGTETGRDIRQRIVASINAQLAILAETLAGFDLRWRSGFQVAYLHLPDSWTPLRFTHACENAGVLIIPSDAFTINGTPAPNAVRIAINAQIETSQFRDACQSICRCLRTTQQDRITV